MVEDVVKRGRCSITVAATDVNCPLFYCGDNFVVGKAYIVSVFQ